MSTDLEPRIEPTDLALDGRAPIIPLPIEFSRACVRLPCGKTDFHKALWRIFQLASV